MKLNKSTVAMRNVINPRQVVLEQLCSYSPVIEALKFFAARELGKYETFKSRNCRILRETWSIYSLVLARFFLINDWNVHVILWKTVLTSNDLFHSSWFFLSWFFLSSSSKSVLSRCPYIIFQSKVINFHPIQTRIISANNFPEMEQLALLPFVVATFHFVLFLPLFVFNYLV